MGQARGGSHGKTPSKRKRYSSQPKEDPLEPRNGQALAGAPDEIPRAELARLLISALAACGNEEYEHELQKLTGVETETAKFRHLKQAIIDGEWPQALQALDGLFYRSAEDKESARDRLCNQWFVELVRAGEFRLAAQCLREHIAPLSEPHKLELYSWLLCTAPEDLCTLDIDVIDFGTRKELLHGLIPYLEPTEVIRPERFQELLNYASKYQDIVFLTSRARSTDSSVRRRGGDRIMYPEPVQGNKLKVDWDIALVQGIRHLGYEELANALAKDLRVQLQTPECKTLQANLRSGDWSAALAAVAGATPVTTLTPVSSMAETNGFGLFDTEASQRSAAAMILRYAIEQLRGLDTAGANHKAVSLLKLYGSYTGEEQELASFLVERRAPPAQRDIWEDVLPHISNSAFIPSNYFVTILDQARKYLAMVNVYWCQSERDLRNHTILRNFPVEPSSFPLTFYQELPPMDNGDEVWDIAFSHDGKILAGGYKSGALVIWDTDNYRPEYSYPEFHEKGIQALAWSPDDKFLLTGGKDGFISLWSQETANKTLSVKSHDFGITSGECGIGAVCWLPSGKQFLSGGFEGNLILWNLNGVRRWRYNGIRVMSMSVFDKGRKLAVLSTLTSGSTEQRLYFLDIESWEMAEEMKIRSIQLTSLSISSDSRYFLVNVIPDNIRIWDIFEQSPVLRHFAGPRQAEYTIRSSFGGPFDKFVLSGSDDKKARIFNRFTGELVAMLEKHQARVNTVQWSPTEPVIATASDDGTIMVWKPESQVD